jgi:hypothetical protein
MSVWIQYAAVILAIVIAASPKIREVLVGFSWPSLTGSSTTSPMPSFKEAIEALSLVRTRIVATGNLEDSQRQAIDALTLALVDGSDKQ